MSLCKTLECSERIKRYSPQPPFPRIHDPLPDASVLLSTVGHAPLDLGGVEMAVLPGRHGGLHLTGTHPLECLGHLRLGIILRVSSLNVGQEVGEGATFVGKLGSPTDLAGDGLAPLSIMVAFCRRGIGYLR